MDKLYVKESFAIQFRTFVVIFRFAKFFILFIYLQPYRNIYTWAYYYMLIKSTNRAWPYAHGGRHSPGLHRPGRIGGHAYSQYRGSYLLLDLFLFLSPHHAGLL
jgi:hypothetical protein